MTGPHGDMTHYYAALAKREAKRIDIEWFELTEGDE